MYLYVYDKKGDPMNTHVSTSIQEKQDYPFFFGPVNHFNIEKQKHVNQIWLPVINRTETDIYKSPFDGKFVSEEDYWSTYYEMSDVSLEWNNGRLEEKPMPDRESFEMYSWLWRLLTEYFDTFDEGMLIGLETGFKLRFDNHTSIRKPDLAFIHKNNPNQMAPFDKTYCGCFDICFEFLSDSDKAAVERDTVVKKHEYEKFGVKEYYILDRMGDETAFYYLDPSGVYKKLKPDHEGVIHSKVLNKFKFREEDLYNRQRMIDLIDDSVYREYVMVQYQKERDARKKAELRADKAESRADKAESRAVMEKSRANKAESRVHELENELTKLREQVIQDF